MRYLHVSPQKARLVLELIKGRRVEEARNTLAFTKKRVAAPRGQAAAIGHWITRTFSAPKESRRGDRQPVCEERDCQRGTAHERIRPAPQGRAYRYQRRISHIELILAERGKSGDTGSRQAGSARSAVAVAAKGKRHAPAKKAAAGKKKAAAK